MSNEESIFAEAMGMPSDAERAAYLDRACAGDAQLRRDVEALLWAHGRADGVLESAPAASPADPTSATFGGGGGGRSVGRYKLLEQIGAGGMGVVYMAEQQRPVRRVVALKIIKPGMDSRQVIARFEAERQALTMMDHPNIAKVLDAGTTDGGLPYFVMELVKGVPITDFCDQAHLTMRERLELFIPVCHAVQHAHQKGIIHRDLKPSNILVTLHDDRPVPKVIDFGIAKATGQALTDKTLFTNYAQLIGTPAYMSPEQAAISALDVDTRSDVYSLGVLLYELLTGTTPFEKRRLVEAAYDEVRRIIREEEPPKPSTRLGTMGQHLAALAAQRQTDPKRLGQLVRGELDWIVMRCLEKDRGRRYDSPTELARDVGRYLVDEPVQACPPSLAYKVRKFVRKHRVKLATTGALAVALLGGTAVVGWDVRDRQSRRLLADQAATHALADADRLYAQGKPGEALAAARRAEAVLGGGPATGELTGRVRSAVADLELVQTLEDIRSKAGDALWGATDYRRTAEAYAVAFRDAGLDVDALPVEEAARRIRARPGIAVYLASALDDMAVARGRRYRFAEADIRKLHAITAAADDDRWRRRVRDALADVTRTPAALEQLADDANLADQPPQAVVTLAVCLMDGGRTVKAIELLRREQRAHPGDFWVNFRLAEALQKCRDPECLAFARVASALRPDSGLALAYLYAALRDAGKVDEAQEVWRRAEFLRPDDEALQRALGQTLRLQGKVEAANAATLRAVELARRALDRTPRSASAHLTLAGALLAAGDALHDSRLHEQAIAAFTKAEELEPLSAADHCAIADALENSGLLDQALAHARRVIELDPNSSAAHNLLGHVYDRKGKRKEATSAYREAVKLNPMYATPHFNLGLASERQLLMEEAALEYREAIRLQPDFAESYQRLVHVLSWRGRLTEAEAVCRDATRLMPGDVKSCITLCEILDEQERFPEAELAARSALAVSERLAAGFPLDRGYRDDLMSALGMLSTILKRVGKHEEAIECITRAIVLLDADLGPQNAAAVITALRARLQFRAEALITLGRYAEAIRDCDRALALPEQFKLPPTAVGYDLDLRLVRAAALVHAGDYAGAVADVERAGKLASDGDRAYPAARVYAAAAGASTVDRELRRLYGDRAVSLLRRVAARGYTLSPAFVRDHNLVTDAAFDPLRGRDDFKALAEAASLALQARSEAYEGNFQSAKAKFLRSLALEPSYDAARYLAGSVLVYMGDRATIQEHCREMLARDGATSDRILAERAAKTMASVPSDVSGVPPERIVELADRAVANETPHRGLNYFRLAKGMAEYRAGRFDVALEWLRKVTPPSKGAGALRDLFVAMAEHRLGHAAEALESLKRGVDFVDRLPKFGSARYDGSVSVEDFFFCLTVRREAESLILGSTKGPTSQPTTTAAP